MEGINKDRVKDWLRSVANCLMDLKSDTMVLLEEFDDEVTKNQIALMHECIQELRKDTETWDGIDDDVKRMCHNMANQMLMIMWLAIKDKENTGPDSILYR